MNLHRHSPVSERELHHWTYNSDTYTLEISKWVPRASHKKGEDKYFQKWFTLSSVMRLAALRFMVKSPYSDGTQVAQYELSGSSDTVDPKKPCYWEVINTPRECQPPRDGTRHIGGISGLRSPICRRGPGLTSPKCIILQYFSDRPYGQSQRILLLPGCLL